MHNQPHTQISVVGADSAADSLYAAAVAPLAPNKTVLRLTPNQVVAPMLPRALAETLPNLPAVREFQKSFAVICSNFTCQPPVSDANELAAELRKQ